MSTVEKYAAFIGKRKLGMPLGGSAHVTTPPWPGVTAAVVEVDELVLAVPLGVLDPQAPSRRAPAASATPPLANLPTLRCRLM
jgi:hypothetical protein